MSHPIITGKKVTVQLNQSIAASELFTLTAGSAPVVSLTFEDFNTSPTSGFFILNNIPVQQGNRFTISLSELSQLRYVGGSKISFERVRIFAQDSMGQFSEIAMTSTLFTVRPNTTRPFARTNNFSVVANESISVANAFFAHDPDGHPITKLEIRDTVNDFGFFTLNGTAMPQGQWFEIDPDQLPQLRYRSSGPTRSETIEMRAFDGVDYSFIATGTATTIVNASRPVARYAKATIPGNQPFGLAGEFDIFDADQNTMKSYRVLHPSPHANAGDLVLAGNVLPRQTWIEIPASQINQLQFVPLNQDRTQRIRYRAYDGRHWSLINSIDIASTFVTKPIFTATAPEFYDSQRETQALNSLFSKQDAGVPYTQYEIFQPSTGSQNGYFATGGLPRQRGQIHSLTPAQFANTAWITGGFEEPTRETLYVRAYNDQFWGDWERVDFSTHPEIFNTLNGGVSWMSEPMNSIIPRNSLGQPILTYSFMQEFPDYGTGEAVDNDPPEHFAQFTAQMRAHTRLAMAQFESIANVQLVEVADTSTNVFGQRGGIFRLGEYGLENSNAGAFAFFPNMAPEGGDMWFNRINMDTRLIPGSSGFTILLHEFGHALGLKHPHEGFGSLPPSFDSSAVSVMSYSQGFFQNPYTFQYYDIHHLQQNYGVNMSYRTGDDIYDLDRFKADRGGSGQGNRLDEVVMATIWDAGGTDTLSAKGSLFGATVDLRQGMPSSIGHEFDLFELFFNGVFVEVPAVQNVRIAIGVDIEKAVGGDHDDILIGNHLDNILTGGLGNDYLRGGAGNDLLLGGDGDNVYEFGIGDGFNRINQEGFGGQHRLIVTPFPRLNLLEEDVVFRRINDDLVVDLRVDFGDSQGITRILNHYVDGNQVQTLEFAGTGIDLMSVSDQVTGPGNHRFRATTFMGDNGFLVVPA